MVDQEEYNKEHDKLIDDKGKKGIRLLKNFLEPQNIEIPETPFIIDFSKAKLKTDNSNKIVVKEFKPKSKKDKDESIW